MSEPNLSAYQPVPRLSDLLSRTPRTTTRTDWKEAHHRYRKETHFLKTWQNPGFSTEVPGWYVHIGFEPFSQYRWRHLRNVFESCGTWYQAGACTTVCIYTALHNPLRHLDTHLLSAPLPPLRVLPLP